MCKPSNINKIHRFLDEFYIVDYACYGADKLPEGKLDLYFDKCDKKVYVHQGDIVYGSLKLNEMEQKFIFPILSSGMNLLECSRVPSDEKTPLEQKFKVSLWMKCLPFGCVDKEIGVVLSAVKEGNDAEVEITIHKDKVVDNTSRNTIKKEDVNKYKLAKTDYSLSIILDEKEGHKNEVLKVECKCCSIQKIQELIGLFKDCCDNNITECC